MIPPTPRRTRSSSSLVGVVPAIPTKTQRAASRSNWSMANFSLVRRRTVACRDVAGKSGCCADSHRATFGLPGALHRQIIDYPTLLLPDERALGNIQAKRDRARFECWHVG